MEIRQAVHPQHAAMFTTEKLREHFLVEGLFQPGQTRMLYSYYDRLIIAGVVPLEALELDVDEKIIGASHLLERREMGIINIGGAGKLTVDGTDYNLASRDGLYIGMGARETIFHSADASQPAKFYVNCAPAHATYPTARVAFAEATPIHLGEMENSNKRTIRKYIHPDGVRSCQLVMGMTTLEPGLRLEHHAGPHPSPAHGGLSSTSTWPTTNVVFHFMGEPDGDPPPGGAQREVVLSPQLVDPLRRRNGQLHIHLGHGRREPDLHRHGRGLPCANLR